MKRSCTSSPIVAVARAAARSPCTPRAVRGVVVARCRGARSAAARRPRGARRASSSRAPCSPRRRTRPSRRPPAAASPASMFAASSKRARSSIDGGDFLAALAPPRAARRRTASPAPVRYSVCLIASTSGSVAAGARSRRTGANDSYGWCSRTSPRADRLEEVALLLEALRRAPATNGGYFRSGRVDQLVDRDAAGAGSPARSRGTGRPGRARTSRAGSAPPRRCSRWRPRGARRRRSCAPDSSPLSACSRSSTSSSSTHRSLLRVTRNWWHDVDLHAREQLVHVRVDDRREQHELVRPVADRRAAARSGAAASAAPAPRRRRSSRPKASSPSSCDDEVEALVEDARERVRRIEADRRQHRQRPPA